jgi:O-antigen/teichoic acid export membrane protein
MSVTRHTAYNLLGTAAPILVALTSIPFYLDLIGDQRYGMLSIAWILLGYFGAFDLGIGRAAAQRIAKLAEDHTARAQCFWTALAFNSTLGVLGGLAIWPVAHYFFASQFQIDTGLRPEVLDAIPWLILALPMATITGVLSGALQGVERFLQLNTINATGSILFQVLPLLAAWLWSPDLGLLMPVAIAARLIGVVFLFWACIRYVAQGAAPSIGRNEASNLLKFGGWVTVSSLISPVMVMADRFIIGAVLGSKAVTHYAVPFQLAERTTIIPGALSASLFPRFAKDADHEGLQMAVTSLNLLLVIMTPMIVVGILLAHPFLALWISIEFANQSALVLQILLVGYWVNGLARIPHARLQATGRPRVVAICHLMEILPYLILLFLGLQLGGVAGAALAFSSRVLVDYLLLSGHAKTLRPTLTLTLAGVFLLVSALLLTQQNLTAHIKIVAGTFLVFLTLVWSTMHAPYELKQRVKNISVSFSRNKQ